MMIQKFNNNHAPDEQRPTSTVRAAKIQVAKKPIKKATDKIILLIANVHKSINYFEIKWKNGSSLKLYFNGRYEKYKRNGKLASAGGVGSRKHTGIYENGHIFLFINGNMITFERLVAICVDFHHNCVAADYNGLLANMKDGSGSKDTADGQWYFEAFDGLTIAKFDTTLSVGFIDPYERTSVLDPEIIPNMANKGDILTSSVMSQIVTSNTSLMYGTANKIGEFCDTDGSKLGDIIMPDLRSFFISDIFFAPNITVQDLK